MKTPLRYLLLAPVLSMLAGCGEPEPAASSAEPVLRLLTESQYRNSIADIFGDHIVVAGRFSPLPRQDGLLAIGAASVSITPSAFERFDTVGRSVAAQVVNEENRDTLVGCSPRNQIEFDEECAQLFLPHIGQYLFRRPLNGLETSLAVDSAREATEVLGDFYDGLGKALAGLLVSPSFLYIADILEADPEKGGTVRLTGYSKAARLSYLLWDSTPDDALLKAAGKGELHTEDGLRREVDRLIDSPRFLEGVKSFFADMLALDQFETLEKDPDIYPAFSHEAIEDAKEQVLRTIADLLIVKNEDYREIFTTRSSYISAALGRLYKIPVSDPDNWVSYDFSNTKGYGGLHTLIGFTALHSHPGRSSPTLRGKAIRELFLCQQIPDPPGDVDFTLFNDPSSPIATARQRLDAHNSVPSCAGCHKLMDPIGFAVENFDGAGQFRVTENGEQIDTSGELGGMKFNNAIELGQALYADPQTSSCLVARAFSYAAARSPRRMDREALEYFESQFRKQSYRISDLFRMLATSNTLFAVDAKPSETKLSATKTNKAKGQL